MGPTPQHLRRWTALAIVWAGVSALAIATILYTPLFEVTSRTWRNALGSEAQLSHETEVETVLSGSRGRVLVTGGGGNIGKYLVRRLLAEEFAVTVLDKTVFEDEMDTSSVTVLIGDIRNETLLAEALTSDVSGVINLAAVSRVLWCLENVADCEDVNVRGTDLVLEAMKKMSIRTGHNPWFVQASSREVYGSAEVFPVTEDSPRVPANVYGATKLRAEEVIEKHVAARDGLRPLKAIALRLSNVYGSEFDHRERLIPSIMTQALAHQVIQIVGGEQDLDMVHIDDVADAFMLAVQRLESAGRSRPALTPSASEGVLEAFNVVAGGSVQALELVRKIMGITQSASPLQTIPGDNRFPDHYVGSAEKASRVLRYTSRVAIDEGLRRLATKYLEQTVDYLERKIATDCSAGQYANIDVQSLNQCTGMVSTELGGRIEFLYSNGDTAWGWHDKYDPEVFTFQVENGDITFREVEYPDRVFKVDGQTSFKVDIDEDTGFVALGLKDDKWVIGPDGKRTPHQFRLTTLCCPPAAAGKPWPFYADSPVISFVHDLYYEDHRSFDASQRRTMCKRMNTALNVAQEKITTMPSAPAPLPTASASEWRLSQMPICKNLCDHPTVCLDTGDCACALSNCLPRQRFPFSSTANLDVLSFPEHTKGEISDKPLTEQVAALSWLNVLRPQVARYVSRKPSYPAVNVTSLPPAWQADRVENATAFQQLHAENGLGCFSADSVLERGALTISSQYKSDSLVFLPNYAGTTKMATPVDEFAEYALANVDGLPPRDMIIPFTFDWGICNVFAWSVYEIRMWGMKPVKAVEKSIAWSVMGDLNTNCYRPHQDVVIPSRTCLQDKLKDAYGDLSKVKPSRQRSILATFSGRKSGTGTDLRRRITCQRSYDSKLPVIWDKLAPGKDYLETLGETVFCPLPRGTTGWATRTIDAVYSGCIPVIFENRTHHPFWNSLNWAKFSITVDEADVYRLEEILLGYSWEEVAALQANLMLVRDAFIYPSEGHMEENHERRGPFSFAMHETSLLRLTKYPQ